MSTLEKLIDDSIIILYDDMDGRMYEFNPARFTGIITKEFSQPIHGRSINGIIAAVLTHLQQE